MVIGRGGSRSCSATVLRSLVSDLTTASASGNVLKSKEAWMLEHAVRASCAMESHHAHKPQAPSKQRVRVSVEPVVCLCHDK